MFDVEKILKQHIAVLGKTGSGKTSTSKWLIEYAIANAITGRACILDTIKSDWWGLISSADGKSAGLPFTILGGPQAHMPLHASSGAIIGELVATGALPLSIIDMSEFRPGEAARFFCKFAEALMKHMRGVLYLGIEEAHELAPKERSGVGDENMSVYYAKKLATAGRSKGIRLIVNSQRTQALHNAVLGSCETVIVHRMTAPADQEPVVKWLRGNIPDKALRAEIEQSLPKLKAGEAWVCSGQLLVPERVVFPRIKTFDNSATPDNDVGGVHIVSAPVDTNRLRELLGEAEKEAIANDPKALKARIAELERAPSAESFEKEAIERVDAAYSNGMDYGFEAGHRKGYMVGWFACKRSILATLNGAVQEIDSSEPPATLPDHFSRDAQALPTDKFTYAEGKLPIHHPALKPGMEVHINHVPSFKNVTTSKLSPSARKIVDVIHRSYPVGLTFAAAARRAGISNKSSAYSKYCKEVMNCGEVIVGEGPGGRIRSKTSAAFPAGAPVVAAEGLETWIAKLPPSYGKMLRAIADNSPSGLDKEGIASESGVSETSSGLGAGIKELLSLELIIKEGDVYSLAEGL